MILGGVPGDYRMIAKLADSHEQDCRAATLKPALTALYVKIDDEIGGTRWMGRRRC
ncbi:hypothetical protein OOK27_10795 [Streptomyces canus]|nr:hypothetical protein [Streptomyces canus]MCX5254666.1 hypothetical protein [Streptomyces canus]